MVQSNATPILTRVRNFNMICWIKGHNFSKAIPFLNTAKTGYCGIKRVCTRCPKEIKEFN